MTGSAGGTRFISTTEAMADQDSKDMIVASGASDITYTPAVSGIPANFMTASLLANGIDPKRLPAHKLDNGRGGPGMENRLVRRPGRGVRARRHSRRNIGRPPAL